METQTKTQRATRFMRVITKRGTKLLCQAPGDARQSSEGQPKSSYTENASLTDAVSIAVGALTSGGNGAEPRTLGPTTLEVAILDANRPRRAFRRITGAALEALLPQQDPVDEAVPADPVDEDSTTE